MDALQVNKSKSMTTQFALDLRLARRKGGLTQREVAHLLAFDPAKLSYLENGRRRPSLIQVCTLSLIFGRSFESLFGEIMDQARRDIIERLKSIPARVRRCAATLNRETTLTRLEHRLLAELADHGS
jgi:transcriptional regulator with XRE-family HTH domain